jgi:hypothetical protein
MMRGIKPNKDQPDSAKSRRLRLSNINGMILVVAALMATILLSGFSEARFQNWQRQAEAAKVSKQHRLKLAQCPMLANNPELPTVH